MVWKLGDRNIRAGRSWVDENNITHPRNWMSWTDDEKRAAGLAWTDDPKPYDSTWYLGWNSDESALLPRPLAGLQASKVEEAKRQSASALSETDWYVVRKTETNVAIPTEITAYRTAVRTNYASLKTAINDASDIAELQAVYETTAGASNTIKTIDATSSSVVSTSSNTITISGHGFVNDEQVYYDAGINSDDEVAAVIGGLMNNTTYFVHSATTNTFKLSESHSNCGDAAQVQFSSRSSDGTAQSFTSQGIPAKSQTWPNPKMTKYDGA
jgi:hypothetical protein